MLKVYDKLDDVPEALREHYKLIEGKYVPEISDDHPVKLNNTKLLNEKTTAETKVAGLQADLDSAKASGLPRGHAAVPKADADSLPAYKALGTVDELTAKVTEHATLKETEARRVTEDNNRKVAKELGYNPDAFLQLTNLPEFEIREKDGKKTVVAKVKEGETLVEKPAKEYVEANHAPLLPALTAKAGVQVPANGSGQDSQPASQFQSAREYGKQYNESRAAGQSDLESRFGIAKTA